MSGPQDDVFQVIEHPGAIHDIGEILDRILLKTYIETAAGWDRRLRRFLRKLGNMPTKFLVFAPPPPRAVHRTHFEHNRHVYYDVFETERIVRILYLWHGHRGETPDLDRRADPLTP